MTGPINGHNPALPPDPREPVARHVMAAVREQDPDAEEFDALSEDDRAAELDMAAFYISAHLDFIARNGLRLLPVNAVPVPRSEEEALAMVQAAQTFLDARKRKKRLIAPKKPRLILPKGVH